MSATISECGTYRYTLERSWPLSGDKHVLWVMLNPSTADASIDDPTIKRCIGYTKAWGYGGLMVGNLYAFRATKPEDLWDAAAHMDAQGWENDGHLSRMAACATLTGGLIVAAWGGFADPRRAEGITKLLNGFGPVHCIGRTKDGQPWHPLYKAKDLRPILYSESAKEVSK